MNPETAVPTEAAASNEPLGGSFKPFRTKIKAVAGNGSPLLKTTSTGRVACSIATNIRQLMRAGRQMRKEALAR